MRTIRKIERRIPKFEAEKESRSLCPRIHRIGADAPFPFGAGQLLQQPHPEEPGLGIRRGLCRLWYLWDGDEEEAGIPADAGRCRSRED